jgi:putative acetyltransferase
MPISGACRRLMPTVFCFATAEGRGQRSVLLMSTGATATIELSKPHSSEDWLEARRLVEEYAASLHLDLAFQNFEHEKEHLASEYSAPTGAFLIAREHGAVLGCAALRRFAEGDGEFKRLYVVPAARGRGVGALLARRIVTEARSLGYARLLLDTLPAMRAAQALYESLGFKPTAAYRFNPLPGAAFFELSLR